MRFAEFKRFARQDGLQQRSFPASPPTSRPGGNPQKKLPQIGRCEGAHNKASGGCLDAISIDQNCGSMTLSIR